MMVDIFKNMLKDATFLTMTRKKEIDNDTLLVLRELKREYRGTDICLEKDRIFESENLPHPRVQLKILHEIEAHEAISLQYSPIPLSDIGTAKAYSSIGESSDKFIIIGILQPKFDEIYRLYKLGETISGKLIRQEIKKIEFVRHEFNTSKLKVIINDNYGASFKVTNKGYWSKLYELADKKTTSYDKGFSDYFNSNNGNRLYTKLGYKMINFLEPDGKTFISTKIPLEIITPEKYSRRSKNIA